MYRYSTQGRKRVRIRIRRRGRWVLAMLVAAALVLGVPQIFLAGAAPAGGGYVTVVVRPGDTLWDLAEEHGPAGVDPRLTVYRIQKLNGLETATIFPGQVLRIPTH